MSGIGFGGLGARYGLWLGLGLGAASCAPPVNIAGDTLKGPGTGDVFEGVQCSAVRPQTEPDLMAWDPGSRANLHRLRNAGVVAVRYQAKGCNVELELLSNCIGTSQKYAFSPYSANEKKVARNASELFAQLPIGAAELGANIKGGRVLRTDYMLAGQYALPPDATFRASDLRGSDCARATHVVAAIYVGAFVMGAGESREMEARGNLFSAKAGYEGKAEVDVLKTEGDAEACATSQKEGKETLGCGVPLRLGLLALDAPAAPTCPDGSTLQGDQCVRRNVVTQVECPAGSKWNGSHCVQAQAPAPAATAATTAAPSPPSAPAAAAKTPGPQGTPSMPSASVGSTVRDLRRTQLQPRTRVTIANEVSGLDRLYQNTSDTSADKPQLAYRMAETYAEYARAAAGDKLIEKSSHLTAIKHYETIRSRYPSFSKIDDVLYHLGLEYERIGDLKNARSTYLDLIEKLPKSPRIPNAYLAFGEMFFQEARNDPSKWELAAAAYKEVIKYPPPANQAYGYARYKLAHAFVAKGDYASALNELKKVIEHSDANPSSPEAAPLARAARTGLISVYAVAGNPLKAFGFLKPLSGDTGDGTQNTVAMMLDLATAYAVARSNNEAVALYRDLLQRVDSSRDSRVCRALQASVMATLRAASGGDELEKRRAELCR